MFSPDVTTTMLVYLTSGNAAMLVSPTYPPGIELNYHANVFYFFGGKTRLLITSVKHSLETISLKNLIDHCRGFEMFTSGFRLWLNTSPKLAIESKMAAH